MSDAGASKRVRECQSFIEKRKGEEGEKIVTYNTGQSFASNILLMLRTRRNRFKK